MPAKNSEKIYVENGFYHIYNRGVEKRNIFNDAQDYSVFLGYLKEYLEPKKTKELNDKLSKKDLGWAEKEKAVRLLKLNNFSSDLDLLAYALMPNHFHFEVKQQGEQTIDKFCNSLITRYVMYFNRKYKRVGHLFQDVYKAVCIGTEGQLLHLSRYIHNNPRQFQDGTDHQIQYTSLPEYLGLRRTAWIKSSYILEYFSNTNPNGSYKTFVDEKADYGFISKIAIEDP